MMVGRCKIIKRTEGVSTTKLVGKLLEGAKEEKKEDGNAPFMAASQFLSGDHS